MTDLEHLQEQVDVYAEAIRERDQRIASLLSASKPAAMAIPEEVREALTHAAGGWRGAACGTRDDAEGERRSADYNRRAQAIETWLAASPQATATQPAQADDARDAERYRWLRDSACSHTSKERTAAFNALNSGEWWEDTDAAIDAAMTATQPASGGDQ